MKKVLTIAGSDCSGGAGIQADLKTMSALGVYGMSVITAITAQNTVGVFKVQEIDKEMIEAQLKSIFEDIDVDAVKIGMVSNVEIIRAIRVKLLEYQAKNIVVDPVMVSKSGYFLLQLEAMEELKELIAIADVVTPNIPEAEALTGLSIQSEEDMKVAAQRIYELGPKYVLVKGGHRVNDANDLLYDGKQFIRIRGKRIETKNTHGTGCTLSSAITSLLARGNGIQEAVEGAKAYITQAISDALDIGHGVGPVGHFVELYRKVGLVIE